MYLINYWVVEVALSSYIISGYYYSLSNQIEHDFLLSLQEIEFPCLVMHAYNFP